MPGGRPPAPAHLKLLKGRGNGRDSGGRKVAATPGFSRLPPEAPAWLDDEARAEWDRVLPELQRLQLTKELDGAALAAYCETWSLFVRASQDVHANGLTVTNHGKDGAEWVTANPAVAVQQKASAQLRAWATEFGFTPAAEAKVSTHQEAGDGEDNPFAGASRSG